MFSGLPDVVNSLAIGGGLTEAEVFGEDLDSIPVGGPLDAFEWTDLGLARGREDAVPLWVVPPLPPPTPELATPPAKASTGRG